MEGSDYSTKEAVQIWRAWKTAHQMVADREYELAEDELNISFDRFRSEYGDSDGSINRTKLSFSARPSEAMMRKSKPAPTDANPDPAPDCGPIYVEFIAADTLGVQQIRGFTKHVMSNGYSNGIMVTRTQLSSSARKVIASIESIVKVESFMEIDLLVNITHHDLVPRHVILSRDEKLALLKRYRVKETQLPRMLQRDPIARYYGLKRGQVVKIIRTSETAGRYASYRLCV